ncbi:penicillin-binding protein activator [Chitinibacter sp. GC72]|uniref:penicillin-binding protein activator n=1 Tax=Chitinibacter sp. GC72 TaxID=1526917 RepID=UPI0012FC64CA|nr:penicillin-binding protein activator [Chitinibacter sp. GC72]
MHVKNLLGSQINTFDAAATLAKAAAIKSFDAARFVARLAGMSALLYVSLGVTATTAHAEDEVTAAKTGYIALLLPGHAKAFKPAVDQIRAGILAAERVHGGGDSPPLRMFDTTDKEEDVQAQYQKAVDGGAVAVIGPLTKSALNFLADSTDLTVPVIALNSFDTTTLPQGKLYSFGLGVEADAAATAQLMKLDGLQQVVVLQTEDSIAQRLAQSFVAAWRGHTGSDPVMITIANPRRDAVQLKTQLAEVSADAVFLAMDAKAARAIRPFLGNERAIYATSQINPGRLPATTLIDLAGIKYLDMPWLANPTQEGYELYDRVRSSSNDLERLFALGLDAWRIAAILSAGGQLERLDGVTGILSLGADNIVQRDMQLRTMGQPDGSR